MPRKRLHRKRKFRSTKTSSLLRMYSALRHNVAHIICTLRYSSFITMYWVVILYIYLVHDVFFTSMLYIIHISMHTFSKCVMYLFINSLEKFVQCRFCVLPNLPKNALIGIALISQQKNQNTFFECRY